MERKKLINFILCGCLLAEVTAVSYGKVSQKIRDNNEQKNKDAFESLNKYATLDVEKIIHDTLEKYDEFAEERKAIKYYSGYEEVYSDEFKSIKSFSIDFNSTLKCYEIVGKNEDRQYTLRTGKASLFNYLIHLTQCEEIQICNNVGNEVLSSLTDCNMIKSITITNSDISSLDGLEKLTNLESLFIGKCPNIDDLTPIKDLKNINTIKISGTKISDISILSNLAKLSDINLRCNEITNPEVLESLENISCLCLEFNKITDMEQLNGLVEKGVLTEEQASNVVSSCEKLDRIYYNDTYQEETTFLSITYVDFKEAYYFQLFDNDSNLISYALVPDIKTFYPIMKNLSNCKCIQLSNFSENITASDIANCANYDTMFINNCAFSNLDFLNAYSGLTYLYIENCPELVDPFDSSLDISKLENLKTLSIIGTKISNLKPLSKVSSLEAIELKNNNITNFYFLTTLPNLKYVSIDTVYSFKYYPIEEIMDNGVTVLLNGDNLSQINQEEIFKKLELYPEN